MRNVFSLALLTAAILLAGGSHSHGQRRTAPPAERRYEKIADDVYLQEIGDKIRSEHPIRSLAVAGNRVFAASQGNVYEIVHDNRLQRVHRRRPASGDYSPSVTPSGARPTTPPITWHRARSPRCWPRQSSTFACTWVSSTRRRDRKSIAWMERLSRTSGPRGAGSRAIPRWSCRTAARFSKNPYDWVPSGSSRRTVARSLCPAREDWRQSTARWSTRTSSTGVSTRHDSTATCAPGKPVVAGH